MLKPDQVLDPVITCSDYKQICKILHYLLGIFSKLVDLMLVCQQKNKCFLVEVFHSELAVWLGLMCLWAEQDGEGIALNSKGRLSAEL